MGLLGEDTGRDDTVEVGPDLLDGLDLGAGADELRDQLGRIGREIDHRLEPFV